jgi:excisionase family DNA binding protein
MANSRDILLTRTQAAKYLGVKVETLHNWACTGRYNLSFIKIGRLAKYRKSELDDFIDRRTKAPQENGICDICHKEKKLIIDYSLLHNHKRGLLCESCKDLLNWAKDSPEFIEKVIDYLKESLP